MGKLVAAAGLIGTVLVAYALFGAEFMFPRWKRWALGFVGLCLAAMLWIVHPQISDAPQDGSSLSDWW